MNRIFILTIAATLSGCTDFNTCDDSAGDPIGNLAVDLDIRESTVRTRESSAGNLVADAIFAAGLRACQNGDAPCPSFALENMGAVREENCETRTSITAGPVREGEIDALLPFDNSLVTIRLTVEDIHMILERSVSRVNAPGGEDQVGYFLSTSSLRISVNCDGTAQEFSAGDGPDNPPRIIESGSRIQSVEILEGTEWVALSEDPTQEYDVVTNDFIAGGGDGFIGFVLRSGESALVNDDDELSLKFGSEDEIKRDGANITAADAVVAYIRDVSQQNGEAGRPVEGRITLDPDTCF